MKQYKIIWPSKTWVSEDKILAMAEKFWRENENLRVRGLRIGGTWSPMTPKESLEFLEWFNEAEFKKKTETVFVTRTLP